MSNYFFIEPEVAGSLGKNSIVDWSIHPPIVKTLHYHFEGWLGDHLLESFPCYLVTETLAFQLIQERLSGFELGHVEITTSAQFEEQCPNQELPLFYWLKIIGDAGRDDFGIALNDWRLVISKRARVIVEPLCPASCEMTEYKIA